MIYVGIDPGKEGAIAIATDTPEIIKMPAEENRDELVDILKRIKDLGCKVIIEKQITKPVVGTRPCPKCRTPIPYRYPQKGVQTSLINYGIIIGILTAAGVPFEEVDGSTWKKYFKLEKLGKPGSIKLAKQLFPDLVKTIRSNDNIAEALLLSEYGRRCC